MNRNRLLAVMLLLVVGLVFTACPPAGTQVKPFDQMSPMEKSTFLMSLYNKQYDDYKELRAKPEHTEDEKKILEVKYELLGKMERYTKLYAGYAESGVLAPADTEQAVEDLIDELLGL